MKKKSEKLDVSSELEPMPRELDSRFKLSLYHSTGEETTEYIKYRNIYGTPCAVPATIMGENESSALRAKEMSVCAAMMKIWPQQMHSPLHAYMTIY